MKKKRISKKGISPLIATVLLIGFVISIIILVLLWGKNYIEELAEKRGLLAEKQQQCTRLQLEVVKSGCGGTDAEIVIKNKADVAIHKFVFQPIEKALEPVDKHGKEWTLGGLETKPYKISFPTCGRTPGCEDPCVCNKDKCVCTGDKIGIIPHLRVALGHYVPCSKQKITVNCIGG